MCNGRTGAHFLDIAARLMRRILIDARASHYAKRGDEAPKFSLDVRRLASIVRKVRSIRGTSGRAGYRHLIDGSASILFLRNSSLQFQEVGELAAQPEKARDDGCRASCVDWYGNARPLFVQGRIFALLGYEIVEGSFSSGRIRELRRVSFAPAFLLGNVGS